MRRLNQTLTVIVTLEGTYLLKLYMHARIFSQLSCSIATWSQSNNVNMQTGYTMIGQNQFDGTLVVGYTTFLHLKVPCFCNHHLVFTCLHGRVLPLLSGLLVGILSFGGVTRQAVTSGNCNKMVNGQSKSLGLTHERKKGFECCRRRENTFLT